MIVSDSTDLPPRQPKAAATPPKQGGESYVNRTWRLPYVKKGTLTQRTPSETHKGHEEGFQNSLGSTK